MTRTRHPSASSASAARRTWRPVVETSSINAISAPAGAWPSTRDIVP
jgi:hypothetical protein